MNDVLDRLAALRSTEHPVNAVIIAADLRRGRRALHRRRAARGGVLAAGALAIAGIAGTTLRDPAPQVHPHEGVRLVAYAGEQVPGFRIDKVPAGFVLQGATPSNLNVTRPGDISSIHDFVDKIVVMLEWNGDTTLEESVGAPKGPESSNGVAPDHAASSVERVGDKVRITFADGTVQTLSQGEAAEALEGAVEFAGSSEVPPEPPAVEPFDVDGSAATITTNSEGTTTLRYVYGEYTLIVQVWPSLGLTDAQLVEFADGVSVTSDARPGRG